MVTEQRKNRNTKCFKIKEMDKKFRHDTNIFYQITYYNIKSFRRKTPKKTKSNGHLRTFLLNSKIDTEVG